MRSVFFVTLCVASFTYAEVYRGDGTAYSGDYQKDDTGFNACQFGELDDRFEKYYGALASERFDTNDCGKCVEIIGTEADAPGDRVIIMIVDECAGCDRDDVDMSKRALRESTGYSWDRKRIEWKYVDCP